jgi:hypothetical protein
MLRLFHCFIAIRNFVRSRVGMYGFFNMPDLAAKPAEKTFAGKRVAHGFTLEHARSGTRRNTSWSDFNAELPLCFPKCILPRRMPCIADESALGVHAIHDPVSQLLLND